MSCGKKFSRTKKLKLNKNIHLLIKNMFHFRVMDKKIKNS